MINLLVYLMFELEGRRRDRMKKLLNTLLVLSMAFGMLVGVKANEMKINDLNVNVETIGSGNQFTISGSFGGEGVKASNGDTLYIDFRLDQVDLEFPRLPQDVLFGTEVIGRLVQDGNSVKIVFNESVEKYDDINGDSTLR